MTGLFLLLHSHTRRSSKSRYDCCSYRCDNLHDEFDSFFFTHNCFCFKWLILSEPQRIPLLSRGGARGGVIKLFYLFIG